MNNDLPYVRFESWGYSREQGSVSTELQRQISDFWLLVQMKQSKVHVSQLDEQQLIAHVHVYCICTYTCIYIYMYTTYMYMYMYMYVYHYIQNVLWCVGLKSS